MSRKASCGRQRAEDKGELRERVLVDGKGTIVLLVQVGGQHPYIHATVDAKTMWFHHSRSREAHFGDRSRGVKIGPPGGGGEGVCT